MANNSLSNVEYRVLAIFSFCETKDIGFKELDIIWLRVPPIAIFEASLLLLISNHFESSPD